MKKDTLLAEFRRAAIAAGFSGTRMATIMDDMLGQVPIIVTKVKRELPGNFPHHISQPIFNGMRLLAERHHPLS